jgi:uncharacterized protein
MQRSKEAGVEYRKLGKTGLDVSVISLGTEFLVKAAQETVTAVVNSAVEHGVNYFDVLFADPDYRDHFGVAFQGLREKIIISGHLPVNDSVAQCRQSFLDHLTRLRIDAVDIIFVSCCDGEENYRRAMQPGGHYELALEFISQGKARYIGFSSHTVVVALQAVCSGNYDLLMFPINPAFDTLPGETGADNLGNLWEKAYFRKPEDQSDGIIPERKQLYHECARRDIGLLAMKPFAAGWLFRPDLKTGFDPINLIHYALSQPGVSCVVPGVANVDQLMQNFGYLTATGAQKDFSAAIASSRWNYQGTCMYCNHCQPCRAGIDISEINQLINLAASSNMEEVQKAYRHLKVKASACQECGDCMQRCPFGVSVIERMRQAVAMFEAAAG